MANLNRVFLIGRLTRDPQQRFIPSGQSLVEFGIATNRNYTVNNEKREETTFVDITAWGQAADLIHRHLKKGEPIFIEGRLKFDKWETKEGESRSKLSVVCDRFEFLGGGGGTRGDGGGSAPAASQQAARRDSIEPMDFGLSDGGRRAQEADDVPF